MIILPKIPVAPVTKTMNYIPNLIID
jgi:hypothetical protein